MLFILLISLRILFYHLFPFSCILNIKFSECFNFHIFKSFSSYGKQPKIPPWPDISLQQSSSSIVKYLERVLLLKVYTSSLFVHSSQYNMKFSPTSFILLNIDLYVAKAKTPIFHSPSCFLCAISFLEVCLLPVYDTLLVFSTLW